MQPYIIGIAGGTGSGKSTLTERLKERFGEEITVIYHDNYYRCHDAITMEERRKINYDHPEALETELLIAHLKALKAGQTIACPVYDFAQHNRMGETLAIAPSRVIIVEGILLFQNPELFDLLDLKIYVDADADVRILRRTRRDMQERGRSLDDIMEQYLTTVKPMHELYVEPWRRRADLVVNDAMNAVAVDVVACKIEKILKG